MSAYPSPPPRLIWSRVASGALAGGLVAAVAVAGALAVALPKAAPQDRRLECVALEHVGGRQAVALTPAPERRVLLYCKEGNP